jgi:PAS domain-containing protein
MSGCRNGGTTGHISLLNAAARHMFGIDEYSGVGRLYWEVIPQTAIVDMIRQALDDGSEGHTEVEIALMGQGSVRIFQGHTAFVRGENGGAPHVMAWSRSSTTLRKFATWSA